METPINNRAIVSPPQTTSLTETRNRLLQGRQAMVSVTMIEQYRTMLRSQVERQEITKEAARGMAAKAMPHASYGEIEEFLGGELGE
jgi:hypothetical protein